MKKKFRGKYRIESARLQGWDYSKNGYYFVTICTGGRECYFGKIVENKMQLSDVGRIAHHYWNEIPKHFSNVILDEFIIMPNHVHGIIKINALETPKLGVSTTQWKPGTLGVIINQYKRICTINARKINDNFKWQSRFYDHIIRDNKSLNNIRNYIKMNPLNWTGETPKLGVSNV